MGIQAVAMRQFGTSCQSAIIPRSAKTLQTLEDRQSVNDTGIALR
jgi:hypothetical protein